MGGLGFGMKWNMGWMHDTLAYMKQDPIHRRHHHNMLTFSLVYAFNENFVLPLSHDEVVHGKGSLLGKMPGDDWQQFANLRALYALHVDAPRQEAALHGRRVRAAPRVGARGRARMVGRAACRGTPACSASWPTSTACYRAEPALHQRDFSAEGFEWIESNDAAHSVIAFLRKARGGGALLLVACNFTPVPRENYLLGVPQPRLLARDPQQRRATSTAARAGATSAACEAAPVPCEGPAALVVVDAAAAVDHRVEARAVQPRNEAGGASTATALRMVACAR